MGRTKVLLAGECASPYSSIAQHLAQWGADCNFASTCTEMCELVVQHTFDLILSGTTLMDGSVWRVVPLLEGSYSTMYCSYPIEDSCLWIKVVDRGRACLGAPALRPREFGPLLRRILKGEPSVSA
jgi:hypothetical protein